MMVIPNNNAYAEINSELKVLGFERTQGSVYLSSDLKADLATIHPAISKLSTIDGFKKSVGDIRVFRIKGWSEIVKS